MGLFQCDSAEKLGRDFVVTGALGELVRTLPELSSRRRLSACPQQHSDDIKIPSACCSREDRVAVVIRRVGVRAAFQEELNDGDVPVADRAHQGRPKLAPVGLIDFGASVEQHANDVRMAARSSLVQRRLISVVELVDVRPGVQ